MQRDDGVTDVICNDFGYDVSDGVSSLNDGVIAGVCAGVSDVVRDLDAAR